MIARHLLPTLRQALHRQPAAALLGPRQVGKTTLAHLLAREWDSSLYLDLENPADLAKMADPGHFLSSYPETLVILDEIHRLPGLFPILRGLIDEGRRQGRNAGRYLLLGSASLDLLRQSGESLAGRIQYLDLTPFHALEIDSAETGRLWVRGGFPESFLAPDEASSLAWRQDLIRTYLERDIPQFGPRVPAETLRRFWTMLAHAQGGLGNASRLAAALELSAPTITRYLDLLVDLQLVRRLQPYAVNVGKRLTRSPKLYIRDSGLVHALLMVDSLQTLAGHPVQGGTWEGLVIENLLAVAPPFTVPGFYQTSGGAEIDLVLELPGGSRWAIEIKRSAATRPGRGFFSACDDLLPTRSFLVHAGHGRFPLRPGLESIGLRELMTELAAG